MAKYHAYTYAGLGGGISRWDGEAEDAGEAATKAADALQYDGNHYWTVIRVADGTEPCNVHIHVKSAQITYEVAGYA